MADTTEPPHDEPPNKPLVLTSAKRQGVYECDYCGIDITRLPRIRCNECDDFDLCVDCFNMDPVSNLARWKAVHGDAKFEHNPKTHGYRVCDSTRYPLLDATKKRHPKPPLPPQQPEDTDKNSGDADVTPSEVSDAPETDAVKDGVTVVDDPRNYWTAEEDLRLLDGIATHGLGNWTEIAEAVAGPGSVGKNARKCMERYFDDYMGRFGYILPPTALTEYDGESVTDEIPATPAKDDTGPFENLSEEATRSSKRRSALRSPSSLSSVAPPKKYKAVPTDSLPEYETLSYTPYLPVLPSGPTEMGQSVGRDQAWKAEQAYVRAIATSTLDKTKLAEVKKEWEAKVNQPGGPTVLPMRVDDVPKLPGADLAGFMPRRGDFDVEWAEAAEETIADLEFFPGENEEDRNLKLQVLQIYNSKLDERDERKQFVLSRKLYDYRAHQAVFEKLPRDERDLIQRLRLIERFHTPQEHKKFIDDILRAKRLRKEIAKFQMYRRMGIRTLEDVERFELDKNRRLFHKSAIQQKEGDKKSDSPAAVAPSETAGTDSEHSNYWKQYRTQDRKFRRSINRQPSISESVETPLPETPDSPGRRANNLPPHAVEYLRAWLLSPEHIKHPYPSEDQKQKIMEDTGIDLKQLTNWFVNNRKRIWKRHLTAGEKAAEAVDMELEPMKQDMTQGRLSFAEVTKETTEESVATSAGVARSTAEFLTPMDVDGSPALATAKEADSITNLPGFALLTEREVDLCTSVHLEPQQYLEIKKALIYESLGDGMLEGPDKRTRVAGQFRRTSTLFHLDITKRGQVIDFVVRSGWISPNFGSTIQSAS